LATFIERSFESRQLLAVSRQPNFESCLVSRLHSDPRYVLSKSAGEGELGRVTLIQNKQI
jgi:hypothetical protein